MRAHRYFRLDCRVCGHHDQMDCYHSDESEGVFFETAFWFIVDSSSFALTIAKTAERAGVPERRPELDRAVCSCGSDDVVIRVQDTEHGVYRYPSWPPLDPCDRPPG